MTITELLSRVASMLESGADPGAVLATVEMYGDARADEVLAEVSR